MGAHATRKALQVLYNSQQVIGIDVLAACQAVALESGRLGAGTAAAYREVRAAVPHLDDDRVMSADFSIALDLVRSGKVFDAVSRAVPARTPMGQASR